MTTGRTNAVVGGGGQACEQVDNFRVRHGNLSAILTWTAPERDEDESFVGTRVVRKAGSCPASPTDGTVVYEGTALTYTDTGLTAGVTYYYRAFAYNAEGRYQTAMRSGSLTAMVAQTLSDLPEGALLGIEEDGVIVPFYVAKHDYESGLNGTGRTLLVRKDCYDTRLWNDAERNAYAGSFIDAWLNGDYKGLLDTDVQRAMEATTFYYTQGPQNSHLITLQRSVFILSATELDRTATYMNVEGAALPIASSLQIAYLNGSVYLQWTRSIRTNTAQRVFCLDNYGNITYTGCNTSTSGSRPVFTLPGAAFVPLDPTPDGYYEIFAV